MKARLPKGLVTIRQFTNKYGERLGFGYQGIYRRLLVWAGEGKIKIFKWGKVFTVFNEERAVELWYDQLVPVDVPPASGEKQLELPID